MGKITEDMTFTGNVTFGAQRLPGWARSELAQDDLKVYPIPMTSWRVHDAIEQPLPGIGNIEAGVIPVSHYWTPDSADDTFFVAAGRAFRVVGIVACIEVAGTDESAVTATIKKAASGTDIASGTALHSSTIDLKGTVNTNQSLTLSTDLDIPSGTRIGIDFSGTLSAARGCVTVLLVPAPSADDLMISGQTFGSSQPLIRTPDQDSLGAQTRYARARIRLPIEYVAAQSVALVFGAGMISNAADTSCTLDVEAYRIDKDNTIGSDLCATDAQSMNSTSFTDKTFNLTAATLGPGDELDVRIAIACNDASTGSAVIAALASTDLKCDVKG